MFYQVMQGDDWESVVDNDTNTIFEHSELIRNFFHKPISTLQADIFMTGSKEDEFITCVDTEFYKKTYTEMIREIGHGYFYLFEHGGHPAMLSNQTQYVKKSLSFLERD